MNTKEITYGKFDELMYSKLTTDHPIDLCRYQVANCYMGRAGLINSGGASEGKPDLKEVVRTAIINKRAGGMGVISGRKSFQRPMKEGIELLHAIQDVYWINKLMWPDFKNYRIERMKTNKSTILTMNAGSSSIKFALYEQQELQQLFYGEIENLGTENTQLNFTNTLTNQSRSFNVGGSDRSTLIHFLIDWLKMQEGFNLVKAIGHRIVQGMQHRQPEKITARLFQDLQKMSAYDPEHLPGEIELIEAFRKNFPDLDQVACFDTAFHSAMPKVATLLAIPRKYYERGIQRYGFHGLSYAYLMEELYRLAGPEAAKGKIIIAHLGSGSSLAAIKDGKSIDTSMGFTPTAGLLMATRTGDLDPGVAFYLMKEERLSPEKFNRLINHQSGLLGISETSSDIRELLKTQDTDIRSSEAIELFCYQAKKWIGSFAAALGGLNALIFSGGIGEHIPEVRERICQGLQFLGIEIDTVKNKTNADIISLGNAKVIVRVMHTNEELMIAKLVSEIIKDSDNT